MLTSDSSNKIEVDQQDINDECIEDFLNTEMYSFDMVDGEKRVGEIYISIHRKKVDSDREKQTYQDSFFVEGSNQLKPILEIDGFSTIGSSGEGYGRAGLQRAYEMSVEKGCEGRMEVHATWGAGSFYEHCGFRGKEAGKPGIKYFEPTPENVEKLYKGGKRENLMLQETKSMDLGLDNFVQPDIGSPEIKEGDGVGIKESTVKTTLSPLVLKKLQNVR